VTWFMLRAPATGHMASANKSSGRRYRGTGGQWSTEDLSSTVTAMATGPSRPRRPWRSSQAGTPLAGGRGLLCAGACAGN